MEDPLYDDYGEPPEPRVSFSLDEGIHLAVSVLVLAVAFSFALTMSSFLPILGSGGVKWDQIIAILPYSVGIVVTAFVLHELAHKIVAQRLHMWAEFRASIPGLGLGLLVSALVGVVLAAPGAVLIFGRADDRDAGHISIVGPLVNLAIGFLAAALYAFAPGLDVQIGDLASLFEVVMIVNAILALFNMLPVPPLDGSKVWRWSKLAYVGVVMGILALFWLYFAGTVDLLG